MEAYNRLSEKDKNEVVVKRSIGFEKFDDKIRFKRSISNASCNLSDI